MADLKEAWTAQRPKSRSNLYIKINHVKSLVFDVTPYGKPGLHGIK
jgi:hypothetical protein